MRNIIYGNTGTVHRATSWECKNRFYFSGAGYYVGQTLCGETVRNAGAGRHKPDKPTTSPVTCKSCLRIMDGRK